MSTAMNHKKRSRRGHIKSKPFNGARIVRIVPATSKVGFMQRLLKMLHMKEDASGE